MITNKKHLGFTLIELMIVIAIIAILMSYAIPAYRDFTVRAKAGEGVSMSSSLKSLISEHWVNTGIVSDLNSGSGNIPVATSLTGNNVSQILVTAGVIEVFFMNDVTLSGESLTMTPNVPGDGGNTGSSLLWVCSSSLNNRFLPVECRTP